MALSTADADRIAYTLGVMSSASLGTGMPELVPKMQAIFRDRIATLPWVPPSWLKGVQDLQGKYPADLIRPAPGRDPIGNRSKWAPSFADTDAKLDVWQQIYEQHNLAVVAYAKALQDAAAAQLDALYADAAFWDAAYNIAVTVRDLPAAVVGAVGGGISDFVGTFLPDALKAYAKWVTLAIGLLVVGGIVLWYRKRLGGLIKGLKGGAK